jgi:glycosyltransferase involved in cell wall biosynthesis
MTITSQRPTLLVSPAPEPTLPSAHFLFLSSCPEPWGGSEELWAAAARKLAGDGHRVSVCKTVVARDHPRIRQLIDAGIRVDDFWRVDYGNVARAIGQLSTQAIRKRLPRAGTSSAASTYTMPLGKARALKLKFVALFNAVLAQRIKRLKPDFAVVSQGENFDGVHLAWTCRKVGLPYVLICQKATDHKWPMDAERAKMQETFRQAHAVYFVSEHNRNLTERQLGFRLPQAEIVRNPYLTQVDDALPYPKPVDGRLRMACVGRLFVQEKGQDTLLAVLSQPKWRSRNVDVDIYGEGVHRTALEESAQMQDLRNVDFAGFTNEVTAIWKTHQILVLPSRCEGLPLVLVEAMLCGRPSIVTDVGGNSEVVDDGETGFIARGVDAASFDEAMERAWNRRDDWERMGRLAAQRIRQLVPANPGDIFAEKLVHVFSLIRKEGTGHRTV